MTAPRRCRLLARLVMAAGLCCGALQARSHSDEPWVARAPLPAGTRPLLALIVDTSAAMADKVAVRAPYDPGHDYAVAVTAPCDPRRVYWRRGPGAAPDCRSAASLPLDAASERQGLRCQAARDALAQTGVYVTARAAQWNPGAAGGYWRELRPGNESAVECRADRGVHGAGSGPWYAAHGTDGPWSRDAGSELLWDAPPLSDSYVFLTGNYLNYLAGSASQSVSRHAWMTSQVASAAASVDELDLAILRLSHDGLPGDDAGRGGMVAMAPAQLPAAAASIANAIKGWSPAGPAPLAETLVETAAWLTGGPVLFGDVSQAAPGVPLPSAASVREPLQRDTYLTPFTTACRPISIGLVTAGRPSADDGAGAAAARLPGITREASACGAACLSALAAWLRSADLLPAVPGQQRAALFIAAPQPPAPAIHAASAAAGTPPLDLADPLALVMMMAHALQHDAATASGARVSAAGFAAAAHGQRDPAVYFSLSVPQAAPRWAGNVRKYRWQPAATLLASPVVVGADGVPAFDDAGTALRAASRSIWSAVPDGADALHGGAAGALPSPSARRLYTDLTSSALSEPANRVIATNPALNRETLGLAPRDPRSVDELIAWALGADAFDTDGDGRRDEPRAGIGDPGLLAPVVLAYGGPDDPVLVFAASNDGLLHALDDAAGSERWAFMPHALLHRLSAISSNVTTVARSHGLDGPIVRHVLDANGDGRVTPGSDDRAWLFVGSGRGAAGYYALDVTDPDRPRVLWSLTGAAAAALGESWPGAVVARMKIDARRQGAHRVVVVLAGGHDPAQSAWPRARDELGARLMILDAESGEVLWQAAGPGDDQADLTVEGMSASLPAAPRVLDTDGDGFADTLYLLDVAGHLWRIGFAQGMDSPARASATLLGRFGAADIAGQRPRRFYSTPDVSYDAASGRPRFIVSFGSGWLARPRDTTTDDRFYAVYDEVGATAPRTALRDEDLFDVTSSPHTAPPDARGWTLQLNAHGRGEKTVGSSLTFDHRLRFATYQPLAAEPGRPCGPPAARSRLYTLDVRSGQPLNWIGDQPVPSEDLAVQGLPPDLRVLFPPRAQGPGCGAAGCSVAPFGLVGGRSLDLNFRNDPVKASWRRLEPTRE